MVGWSVTSRRLCGQEGPASQLDRVDGFVLLDLLGSPGPLFKR